MYFEIFWCKVRESPDKVVYFTHFEENPNSCHNVAQNKVWKISYTKIQVKWRNFQLCLEHITTFSPFKWIFFRFIRPVGPISSFWHRFGFSTMCHDINIHLVATPYPHFELDFFVSGKCDLVMKLYAHKV